MTDTKQRDSAFYQWYASDRYDGRHSRQVAQRAFNEGWEARGNVTDEFTLLSVLADIRQKTGVGDKVMLSELADTLGDIIASGRLAAQSLVELSRNNPHADEFFARELLEKMNTGKPRAENSIDRS